MILKFKSKRNFNIEILDVIRNNGICIVKNFFSLVDLKKLNSHFKKKFISSSDIRVSGKFLYKQKDYKRLDIGDSYINPRFSRFLLFCEWNIKNKKIFKLLNNAIKLRNKVCAIKKDKFCYNFKRKYNKDKNFKFCDMVRLIQYPVGGGFLMPHRDKSDSYPEEMINMLIPFSSRKKKDVSFNTFEKGGLYYILNKKKVDIEKYLDVGDLVFHDQNIIHGVNSIDEHKPLNLKTYNGRLTLNFSIGKFYLR